MGEAVASEIEDLRNKITLYEGNHKAHYEGMEWTIRHNKDLLSKLRADNKELQKQLRFKAEEGDMVSQAFENLGKTLPPDYRNVSVLQANDRFDQGIAGFLKKHNLLKHQIKKREDERNNLRSQLSQLELQSKDMSNMDCPEGKELRSLENQLDKNKIKLSEAQHIQKIYQEIIQKLQEERLWFDTILTELEQNIKGRKKDFDQLSDVYAEAVTASYVAKEDLSVADLHFLEARREREKILEEFKKKVDLQKEQADRIEKRLQRSGTDLSDEMEPLVEQTETKDISAIQQQRLLTYEEAMEVIKDATGVSGIQDVVKRFLTQGDTQKHLVQLKEKNIGILATTRQERTALASKYEEMKYSGETRVSTGERALEEFNVNLEESQQQREAAKLEADRYNRVLNETKSGVDHLAGKLSQLKASRPPGPKPQGDIGEDEKMLDLLYLCEQKLVALSEELAGKDLDEIQREIEDQQFRNAIEGKLPTTNIRVKLPSAVNSGMDDDEIGDDEAIFSRDMAKRATRELIDLQSKKKVAASSDDAKKTRKR